MNATLSRQELQKKLDAHDTMSLVECLPLHTYEQGHIPGAICLPPDEVRQLAAQRLPNQDAEIICYSESAGCKNAEIVAQELTTMGYKNVRLFPGGKADWVDAGGMLQAGGPPDMLPETEMRASAQKAFQQA